MKQKELKEFTNIFLSPETKKDENGSIYVLRASDIKDGTINPDGLAKSLVTSKKIAIDKYLLLKDDIVFQAKGTKFEATVVDKDFKNLISSKIYFNIRLNSGLNITPEYLTWFINSRVSQKYFESNSNGAIIKTISKKSLESLLIPIPEDKDVLNNITDLIKDFTDEKKLTLSYLEDKNKLVDSVIESHLLGDYNE